MEEKTAAFCIPSRASNQLFKISTFTNDIYIYCNSSTKIDVERIFSSGGTCEFQIRNIIIFHIRMLPDTFIPGTWKDESLTRI